MRRARPNASAFNSASLASTSGTLLTRDDALAAFLLALLDIGEWQGVVIKPSADSGELAVDLA